MKVLWFPRIQPDINKLHLTTWREMCKELETLGCNVKIAITGENTDNILDKECIEVFLIKKKYLRILSFWISGYTKFVKNYIIFKPDLVILDIYSVWFSIPFIFLPRKSVFIIDDRTPRYDSAHHKSSFQDNIIKLYTKLCYTYSKYFLDGITVITSYYKRFVHQKFSFPVKRIGVWGSGVDIKKFYPQKHKNRLSHLNNKFIIMQHGELSYNRGLLETIEAVSMIDKEDVVLVLIGEGAAKVEICEHIKREGLEDKIFIVPPVPHFEIPEYISRCNCAIMAYPDIEYWNNNNPIKLLEYLAMGKIIICTDIWTFRNVAQGKKCIHYIKENKPENIAMAINYCYDNRDILSQWGKEGVVLATKEYTWHKQAENLLDFVHTLQKNDPVK